MRTDFDAVGEAFKAVARHVNDAAIIELDRAVARGELARAQRDRLVAAVDPDFPGPDLDLLRAVKAVDADAVARVFDTARATQDAANAAERRALRRRLLVCYLRDGVRSLGIPRRPRRR